MSTPSTASKRTRLAGDANTPSKCHQSLNADKGKSTEEGMEIEGETDDGSDEDSSDDDLSDELEAETAKVKPKVKVPTWEHVVFKGLEEYSKALPGKATLHLVCTMANAVPFDGWGVVAREALKKLSIEVSMNKWYISYKVQNLSLPADALKTPSVCSVVCNAETHVVVGEPYTSWLLEMDQSSLCSYVLVFETDIDDKAQLVPFVERWAGTGMAGKTQFTLMKGKNWNKETRDVTFGEGTKVKVTAYHGCKCGLISHIEKAQAAKGYQKMVIAGGCYAVMSTQDLQVEQLLNRVAVLKGQLAGGRGGTSSGGH
ncbi:hypothetical protein RhiJN_13099 [Ceratobasidium sp. AG-Ba]|nr:hypothetical protein RhiJN_13099 [Ceratobasidium sp. AG-Ba]